MFTSLKLLPIVLEEIACDLIDFVITKFVISLLNSLSDLLILLLVKFLKFLFILQSFRA